MYYSKVKQFLSSLLIFSILFSISFRLPFLSLNTYAGSSDFYDLVSIIVDEDTYDKIDSELNRYAKDIQGVLENTKVVILPTPKKSSAFNISSLNESLYFGGYKGLDSGVDFESKLVGTIIVGNIDLPIVYDNNKSSKTIIPFTDFEDKVYIYNHENSRYEKNQSNLNGLKSEIWHGVISPNFGDFDLNIKGLKDYFNKNHDFYVGSGNFKYSDGILNGSNTTGIPSTYKPYVFYFDQFREEKALNYNSYVGYNSYLGNKEDILYSRYSKILSEKITEEVMGNGEKTITELLAKIDPELSSDLDSITPSVDNVPDIQTRYIIDNVTKKFIEIFASGIIGDFRKNVHNAGRYNGTGGDVNVDMIPYIISVLDIVNDQIIKEVNDELETEIDNLVKNGLSRNIAIPNTVYSKSGSGVCDGGYNSSKVYTNILYGKQADSISTASQCSIFRGEASSGQLVELNRGYNFSGDNAQNDGTLFGAGLDKCDGGELGLNGYYGGNTPLNIDASSVSSGVDLNYKNYDNAIYPIYDIAGGKINYDSNNLNSPLDCLDNNLIETLEKNTYDDFLSIDYCETDLSLPLNNQTSIGFECNGTNDKLSFNSRFENFYKNNKTEVDGCSSITHPDTNNNSTYKIKKITGYLDQDDGSGMNVCIYSSVDEYNFKFIPSYITHKSPTISEIQSQIKSMVSPNLAIDKNRYIDFISAKGNYEKIYYPTLFRVELDKKTDLSLDSIDLKLESTLNEKSEEINSIISLENPSLLSGDDKKIYNLLKIGDYPSADFNLIDFLKSKEDTTLSLDGEEKTISYYDSLVFALYWDKLNSVSSKYAFIFDYYLTDQFGNDENFFLPKNKKEYEIAYLGAPGDSQNMYIKIDPEAKSDNPYADVISNNIDLSGKLLGSNISNNNTEDTFKCAPPEGVPIWEWIPSVMCRLGDMMPPTISISDGNCGSNLLTPEQKEDIVECNGDINKNGINDCIESKIGEDGVIKLSSDSDKYFYNKSINLKAELKDKDLNTLTFENSTDINFEVVKIEKVNSGEEKVVFDSLDDYKNDTSILNDYIYFTPKSVRTNAGVSNYGFSSKSKDSNIYLKANISISNNLGDEEIFLESGILKIEIRGDRLFNSSYKLVNEQNFTNPGLNSVKVSDKNNLYIVDGTKNSIEDVSNLISNNSSSNEKLTILLENISIGGSKMPLSYPLDVKLIQNGESVENFIINSGDIDLFKGISLNKSGSYNLEITDSYGFKTNRNIELIPEVPTTADINFGTTIQEVGGNISTSFVTLYDKYGNVSSGDFYDLSFEIDGDGLTFLSSGDKYLNSRVFEGYEIFRLKSGEDSGNNTINLIVSDTFGNKLIEESKNIEVVDGLNIVARPLGNDIKVGGDTYKYEISIRDKNGNILTDFDSRAYLSSDPIFIEEVKPYFEIKSGVGEVEFKTKTVAGKNIVLEFQIEGLSSIVKKETTILPDSPMKMDLVLSQSKIEASNDSSSNLLVELKDRYDNIVFNDNSTTTSLEILDKYKQIITSDYDSRVVSEGKANYKIYGTQNPGVAYFKVGTNPSLSVNSFIIEDESGNVNISGVGESVSKIETFYFWNKSKLKGKRYNSIYTTLLGSNYGDITQKDYLAGNLLFDSSNRSLAVTSILNNVNSYTNVANISENGGLNLIYDSSDLSQDIEVTTSFIDDKLALNLYNNSLNTYIGKVFYAFDDADLNICDGVDDLCLSDNDNSISLGLLDGYIAEKNSDYISVNDEYGKTLFEIYNDGKINKFVNLNFKFIDTNTSDNLSLDIEYLGKKIATLGYNLNSSLINISYNDDIFNSKVNSLNNAILVLLKTKTYLLTDSGNIGDNSKVLSYNDPFASDFKLSDFSKSNSYGYENFYKQSGLGWGSGNKSLLEFSSGKSVGESVKDFMSFSTINLGDPVISLKKNKKKLPGTNIDKQFDSTIGDLVSISDDILDYRVFDYDNDSKDDILLIKNNQNLSLIENKDIESKFLDKGDLANIVDLGSYDLVQVGDFSGDGYDDIFFVNNKGEPFLLNNKEKNFVRLSLVSDFDLDGRIIRADSFDMDNDGVDDIVTLDDSGSLNIFYGELSKKSHFKKHTLANNYGITLSSEVRNDNSLVYFDGLYQPAEVENQNAKIDNYLYVKYPYNPDLEDISYEESMKLDNELGYKYFIKSKFSDYAGLKVSKRVTDLDGGVLKVGDRVKVDVKIKNVSGDYLYNLAIAEKVYEYFNLDSSTIDSDIDTDFISGNLGYTFLIDGFDLYSGEEVSYSYEAEVKPLSYSYIEVGLFESGEVGDDKYGDVIVKSDNSNCSNPVEIFRSLETSGSRSYQSGTKEPICDEDKIKLPDTLEKNTVDVDGNGVPDYIDNLSNSETALQNYSEEKINELTYDSDLDGIPDNEDNFNLNGSIVIDLGEAGDKIDGALDDLENIVNGLSCGFGNASCWASPMNWAPLAPGNDPTLFGKPIGDGLKVDEGYPILSGLTGFPLTIPCGDSTCTTCIPSVFPVSPYSFDSPTTVQGGSNPAACTGGDKQPGGSLGVDSYSNTFRVFVTPTLTGGVGTAICFGGPARVAGNSVPKAIAPLFPGGNCIVVAQPLPGCNSDGSDGDVRSTGIVDNYDSFGIINGNCNGQKSSEYLKKEYTKKYIEKSSKGPVEELFEFLPGNFSEDPINPPLINGASGDMTVSVDLASLEGGNFEDIIQVQQKRVSPFPSWIMDWVTRQIEEIVNKLTDFPTVFIILPEFEGVFDLNWGELSGNNNLSDTINIDGNISGVKAIDNGVRQVNSGIKEAYEFIGSTPLVYLSQETVNISLPWMSESEINRVTSSRGNTISQRKREIQRVSEAWSFGAICNYDDIDLQQKCKQENDIANKASLEAITNLNSLVSSLRANLDAVKSYKEAPEKINKLINKKEDYLEQILCNIESISSIMGGWLGKNGERFKAWVETYILIKAILKSWQLLVDVFIDYEQECHECKNERSDLLDYEFKLIDMIVPKIPIIKFPKWPDIILDLHNIRAGLNVSLPEFNITTKPILLPNLPELYLPDVPSVNMNVNINLPDIPVLPSLEIPELPDLPTLPTVNLPDLPPPPTLPKMLSEIDVVLDVIKLITKAMCVLKSSPLHPEWRAGDQIAFLTERTGYLSSDFFDLSLPQFSFPFIDSIKVTTYVNLEFESEFIVELARQIAMPLNAFTNDFTNIFNINNGNLDFRNILPTDINIDVDTSTEGIDTKVGGGLGYNDPLSEIFVNRVGLGVSKLQETLGSGKNDLVSSKEFKQLVSKSLSSTGVTSNPKMDKIVSLWKNVNNYSFSKEDKIIKDLKESNNAKFKALKDIINTEIIRNKQLKEDLNKIYKGNYIQKVGLVDNKIDSYNESLSKYNDKFRMSAKNLVNGSGDNEVLQEMGNNLLSSVKTPLESYSESLKENNLLSATTTSINSDTVSANSCQAKNNSDTGYNYEGIYVVEGEKSYRLFDYIDNLKGNEKVTPIDYDLDGDSDLLYLVNGELYLKENLDIKDSEIHVSDNPIVLDSNDNKFYNQDIFYESVNGFNQVGDDSGNINISFLASTNDKVNNYRVSFYTIVDKFLNEFDNNYNPNFIKKDIVDSFAGAEDLTIDSISDIYTKRKNLGYINNLGNSKGLVLETKNLVNIKDDLSNNKSVNIIKGTKLYSGDNSFSIDYILSGETKVENITVVSKSNIELNEDIKIVGISGDAYIKGKDDIKLEGTEIRNFIGKPLFDSSKIYYSGLDSEILDQTYVDIRYYDDSDALLDFDYIHSWEIYDLGFISNDYYIRLSKPNDYYYAKINSFSKNIFSSDSEQILMSPQIESDIYPPELSLNTIRIPVYQKDTIDLTSYIYENSGLKYLDSIYVDFDLLNDSDLNGNSKDDNDSSINGEYKDKAIISINSLKAELNIGPFDNIFKKTIGFNLVDDNGNTSFSEVELEVYSPTPEILDISDNKVYGYINEDLTDEPVNIYRYRGGVIKQIENIDGNTKSFTQNGNYDFVLDNNNEAGLSLYYSNQSIANIDEDTGKINLVDFSTQINVLSSTNSLNDKAFVKIVLDKGGQDIFYQYIRAQGIDKVSYVDSFDGINDQGIYVMQTDTYSYGYYEVPIGVEYNPGSLSIYRLTDTTKTELFTIFNDGRINTVNDYYKLEYDTYNDYIVINLIDSHFNKQVAKVLFKFESDYIMQ